MTQTIDVTGLTPEQIEQIYGMVETFKAINKRQKPLTEEELSTFDLTPLCMTSEILQPFNRSQLYGNYQRVSK